MYEKAVNKSIRMLPRTLESVERLRDQIQSPSFSDTVKCAIEVYDLLVHSIKHGDRILIENKKGKQKQIIIHGVEK